MRFATSCVAGSADQRAPVRAAEFQDGAKPPVLIALELFSLACPSKPLLLGVKAEGR
jgi:hypothetical protein